MAYRRHEIHAAPTVGLPPLAAAPGHFVPLPIFILGGLVGLVEAVLVVTDAEGRRWGDKLAGTKVIEVAS